MASAADRFSRLEKVAIFLIVLGQERTREILADVDVDTLQHLNDAIAGLGELSAEEKAAVMLEFAHFFYEDQMISPGGGGKGTAAGPNRKPGARAGARGDGSKPAGGGSKAAGSGTKPAGSGGKTGSARRRDQEPAAGGSKPAFDLGAGKSPPGDLTEEEQAILQTLDKLRRKLDPGQIDWGKAGYDFGEGFQGGGGDRRT